jgi:Carboxypeptidase regulatory-like domain
MLRPLRVASLFLVFACAYLQAQTSGRILGQVTDPSQAVIPDSRVTAESVATGVKRATVSDSQGRYVFSDLPIGVYRVSAEAKGFQTQAHTDVTLTVASTVTVNFPLAPGAVSETVQVTSEVEAVNTDAANGTLMNNKKVMDLPINGRDYARFSMFTPGAVAVSNYIASLTFDGMHSVHNQFSIDGIDASRVDQPYMANGFERGARLLTGSLDTVEEFRVQTSNYAPEFGRAAGSDIRIVTKSGTNLFHGTAYDFLRNDFFDARNFFNTKPNAMPEIRFNDFGANLGGPIVKDKTFFFANYEGSRQRIGITGTGTVPSASLRSQILATSPQVAILLTQFPLGQTATSDPRISSYTTSAVSAVTENTGSIKVDHYFSPRDHAFLRFNLNDSFVTGPLFGVTASRLGMNDHQIVPITTTNSAFSYQHIFSPNVISDFLVGEQRWGSQLNSLEPVPQVSITGLTVSPGNGGFSRTNSTMYQYGDTISWTKGAHTIKFGANLWKSEVNALSLPTLTLSYTSIASFVSDSLYSATFSGGNPGSGIRQSWFGFFAQDTWRVRKGLTIDYGLRYDIGTPNHDVQGKAATFDVRTIALSAPGGQWYKMNKGDFAPRLGIAWQPTSKTVIRTGYGIFYQQMPPGFGSSVVTNLVTGNYQLLGSQYPGLSYPVTVAGGNSTTTLGGFNWNHPDTYAQQWNFTVNQEIAPNTVLQVAYVGNHGINLRNQRNINLINPATGARYMPQYGNVNIEYDDAESSYNGLQVSLNRRVSKGLMFTFNYTYSKAIDDVLDYGLYTASPQNVNCLSCDRGLGTNDIRNNASANLLYNLPVGRGQHFLSNAGGLTQKLLGNWQFNLLAIAHSGIADTALIGVNTSGDSNTTNQRPNAVAGVSSVLADPTVTSFWNPAAFSIPVKGTFGNAGRGTLTGPDFWNFDTSLFKDYNFSERSKITFRAEVFNVFNHPNFDLPYNVAGTSSFGQILNTFGRTLGNGTSRQMQLALKFTF